MVLAWCGLLAVVLWFRPPAGDDAYHHAVLSVEQVKCWNGGVAWPRFHPDWNGGTGSFAPSIYAPLVLAIQGGACALAGEGSRAVGVALVAGLAAGALLLWATLRSRGLEGGGPWAVAAYPLAAVLARATTTEVWALAFMAPVLVLALPPGPSTRGQGLAVAAAAAALAGCQVGGLLMLAWVLAAAWLAAGPARWREGLGTAAWVAGGVLLGGPLWWPVIREGRGLATEALVGGQYDWRTHHALAVGANAELGPVLLAVFLGLAGVLLLWIPGGRSGTARTLGRGLPAALGAALLLATPLSAPVWRLVPPMAGLQFPWRFLGPATVVGVVLAAALRGRWRWAAVVFLVAPAALIPVEVDGGSPRLTPDLGAGALARRAAVRYGLAPVLPSLPGFYAPGFHPIGSLRALQEQEGEAVGTGGGCLPRAFEVSAGEGEAVLLLLQWWPWLRVTGGEGELPYRNRHGLVEVAPGPGRGELVVGEAAAPGRREGLLMTLAGLALLGALVPGRREEGGEAVTHRPA